MKDEMERQKRKRWNRCSVMRNPGEDDCNDREGKKKDVSIVNV